MQELIPAGYRSEMPTHVKVKALLKAEIELHRRIWFSQRVRRRLRLRLLLLLRLFLPMRWRRRWLLCLILLMLMLKLRLRLQNMWRLRLLGSLGLMLVRKLAERL
jgi:hypothetical protein